MTTEKGLTQKEVEEVINHFQSERERFNAVEHDSHFDKEHKRIAEDKAESMAYVVNYLRQKLHSKRQRV